MFLGSKVWWVCKTDNLTTIYEPIVQCLILLSTYKFSLQQNDKSQSWYSRKFLAVAIVPFNYHCRTFSCAIEKYPICTFYNGFIWPTLRSSGQSCWLQIQKPGFDSRRYQIFWEVVGLELGPFSHVSTIEELLERKSSSSGLESWEYGRRDPSRWPRVTLN
jgi:hypothetical protein